jgi:hypothetical protein
VDLKTPTDVRDAAFQFWKEHVIPEYQRYRESARFQELREQYRAMRQLANDMETSG